MDTLYTKFIQSLFKNHNSLFHPIELSGDYLFKYRWGYAYAYTKKYMICICMNKFGRMHMDKQILFE